MEDYFSSYFLSVAETEYQVLSSQFNHNEGLVWKIPDLLLASQGVLLTSILKDTPKTIDTILSTFFPIIYIHHGVVYYYTSPCLLRTINPY